MAKCKKYMLIASALKNTSIKAMEQLSACQYEDLSAAHREIRRILEHESWKLYTLSDFCEAWNDDMLWETDSTYATVIRVERKKKVNQ